MTSVGVHEAKTRLSKLLRRVATGEEIIILRSGKKVAKLVPAAPPAPRTLGIDAGLFTVPEDFDEPLPDRLQDAFES